ncbi:MAG: patatin-like phospholipase family protein [Holosporales bacterium]
MKWIRLILLVGCVAVGGLAKTARATVDRSEQEEKKTVTILSIDGGGMRGIIPARILEDLERRVGSPLATKFDLMAGTSTGGILALGLNVPSSENANVPKYSPRDLREIYTTNGTTIFSRSTWRDLRTGWGFLAPRYEATGFEAVAKEYFGNTLLSQSITNTLIPGCEIGRYEPIFFRSSKAKYDDSRDFLMRDVARATSAAPTFFPAASIKSLEGTAYHVIDGGVIVNNPAMSALVSAREMFPDADDFMLVSIGTGRKMTSLGYGDYQNQGAIGWVKSLIGLMMDGSSTVVDYQLNELLPDQVGLDSYAKRRYYRIQPVIPASLAEMDDTRPETVEQLTYIAEHMLRSHDHSLDLIADELRRHRLPQADDDFDSIYSSSDSDDEYSDSDESESSEAEKAVPVGLTSVSVGGISGNGGGAYPAHSHLVPGVGEGQDSPRTPRLQKGENHSDYGHATLTDTHQTHKINIPKLRMSAVHEPKSSHGKRSSRSDSTTAQQGSPRLMVAEEPTTPTSPNRVPGGSFDASIASIERPATPVKRGLSSLVNPKRESRTDLFERTSPDDSPSSSPELSRPSYAEKDKARGAPGND